MQFVYLLRCSDGTIYVGCTSNIEERLKRHCHKEVQWTKDRLPVTLITYVAFSDKYKAFQFERYLKSGSGRAFTKKRLFERDQGLFDDRSDSTLFLSTASYAIQEGLHKQEVELLRDFFEKDIIKLSQPSQNPLSLFDIFRKKDASFVSEKQFKNTSRHRSS